MRKNEDQERDKDKRGERDENIIQNPTETRIQEIIGRSYELKRMTIGQQSVILIEFTKWITIITSVGNPQIAQQDGQATIAILRRFIPEFAKYMYWLKIHFQGQGKEIQAMVVMEGTSMTQAMNLVRLGASMCFASLPVELKRRRKRRQIILKNTRTR